MGRSCTADSSIQAYGEACVQSRAPAEVGTLVGRCGSSSKDYILQVVKAPERDNIAPLTVLASSAPNVGKKAGSKGGKASSGGAAMQLDDEWVVEHAAMLERLLPGGLDVVGFYVLCPAAAFASSAGVLAALAGSASKELSGSLPAPLLLLHIDSVTGALALREAAGGGALRPCELKVAAVLDQMVQLQSRYALDLRLPVVSSQQELQAAFQAAMDAAALRLRGAVGLIGGRLASADSLIADLAGDSSAAGSSSSGPLIVELLLQPASSLALSTAGGGKAGSGLQHGRAQGEGLGWVSVQGVLDCRACVHRREPGAAAVEALRADVRRSLAARLDALLDAAEQQQESAAAELEQQQQQRRQHQQGSEGAAEPPQHPLFVPAGQAGKPVEVTLPRRAFVAAAAAGGVPYCDYLFEGESTQAVLGRLQMVLPTFELAGASVECQETSAPNRAGAGKPPGSGSRQGGSGTARLPCTLVTAASVAVAALALAVGYMSLGGQ